MGCKTCIEKLFRVEFGDRGFRSGIPPPLIPGFILCFIGVFLIVGGVLLCILHETYVIARHDQKYSEDNYFLVAGVVAVCLGFVIVCIGGGWCFHVRSSQAEQIEDYNIRKGYSMESINRYAPSVRSSGRSTGGGHNDSRALSDSSYPPEYHEANRGRGGSYARSSGMSYPGYQDPDEIGHLARGGHPRSDRIHSSMSQPPEGPHTPTKQPRDDRLASRASERANKGFTDFKSFVKRNYEAAKGDSPSKREPYSERLTGPASESRSRGPSEGQTRYSTRATDEEFDLAQTYIKNPSQYYAQEQANRVEDAHGGYDVMPVDDRSRGRSQGQAGARRSHNESHDSNQVTAAQQNNGAKPTYRYEKGRPVDSSQDSDRSFQSDSGASSVSASAAAAPSMNPTGAEPVIPSAVRDKATLRYNPKDGQWYYYYRGKPISMYDPNMKSTGSQGAPVYKYINGKPILLPVPTQPLNPPV